MPTQSRKFSIIIPTYSGVKTISKTFESILSQITPSIVLELIIVIDGPNKALGELCNTFEKKFLDKGVPTIIKRFKTNRGRFIARLEGAKLANYDQLLFIDDRVEIGSNYLTKLSRTAEDFIMPDVEENTLDSRPISYTIKQIRRAAYKGKWGTKFKDFYVTKENFERSPKGTTSLWVNKKAFVAACDNVKEKILGKKYVNDDTRILRAVIDAGHKILKSCDYKIYYNPRTDLKSEVKHLIGRGTLFIDYYSKPGTRFFPLFLGFYTGLIALIFILTFNPFFLLKLLIVFLIGTLIAARYLTNSTSKIPLLFIGLLIISFSFSAGIIKGSFIRLTSKS